MVSTISHFKERRLKMSFRLLKCALFVCLISLLHKVAGSQCTTAHVTNVQYGETIQSNCDRFSGSFTQSEGFTRMVARFTHGFLAENNYCEVYEGSDESGELAGIITGGEDFFPVILRGPSAYVTCLTNLTTTNPHLVIHAAQTCGENVTGTMYNLMSPNFPSHYPINVGCVWRFKLEKRTSLVFQFSSFFLQTNIDLLFFKDENDNVQSFTGFRGAFNFRINATTLTLLFVSDIGGIASGFNATVNLEGPPPKPSVECKEQNVTIAVTVPEQQTLDYELGDTLYIALDRETPLSHLNDSCKVMGSDPVFVFDIGQCEAFYKNDNGVLTVSFLIWRYLDPSSAVIQRDVQNKLNVTCIFDSELLLSSSNVQPQAGSAEISAQNTGNFEVALNLFTNQHFNESLPGEVTVPNYIFAEVKLNEISPSSDDYIVQLEECWATRVENSSGLPNYPVVQSGCVAPPNGGEPADAKILMRNYKSNFATVKLKSFVWTNFTDAEQYIYIHCDVTICQNSTGQCPGQTCGGVGRRSVDNNKRNQRLSAGPVHILQTTKYLLVQDTPRDKAKEEANNIFQLVMLVLLVAVIIGAGYLVWGKIALNPTAKRMR